MEKIKSLLKSRKVLALILVAIAAIIILGIISRKKTSEIEQPNSGVPEVPIEVDSVPPLTPPQISQSEHSGSIPTRFSIGRQPVFPVNANVYKKETAPYTRDQAIAIARKVGITSQPFEADDAVSGKMYIFTPDNATLLVYLEQHTIDLKPGGKAAEAITATFDALNAERIARRYLSGLGLSLNDSDLVLDAKDITRDETSEVGGSGSGNTISFRFSYTLEGYKIVGESYNLGTAHVQMNSKNEIVRAYIQEKPAVTVFGKYPVLDYADIVTMAPKKAVIQTINDSSLGGLDVNARAVREIVINSIELAYLSQANKSAPYLQPIFHLKGVATLNTGKFVDVALYMPALKEGVYEIITP